MLGDRLIAGFTTLHVVSSEDGGFTVNVWAGIREKIGAYDSKPM